MVGDASRTDVKITALAVEARVMGLHTPFAVAAKAGRVRVQCCQTVPFVAVKFVHERRVGGIKTARLPGVPAVISAGGS